MSVYCFIKLIDSSVGSLLIGLFLLLFFVLYAFLSVIVFIKVIGITVIRIFVGSVEMLVFINLFIIKVIK